MLGGWPEADTTRPSKLGSGSPNVPLSQSVA